MASTRKYIVIKLSTQIRPSDSEAVAFRGSGHFGCDCRLSLLRQVYVLQTGIMARLWALPIRCLSDWWPSLAHLPPFTLQPWFIRLVSVTWHWHCPLLLLWKLPAGTFTIIWSPDGWKHQTETSAHTHRRTCTYAQRLSHLSHTGPVLVGQVRLPLAPLWKDLSPRGLSCSPGQRGKQLCTAAKRGAGRGARRASPSTHTHRLQCQSAVYDPCLLVRFFIKRSAQVVHESTHK